jgi:hypothetical protein
MNRILLLAAALACTACESDEAKLERLQADKLIACLAADRRYEEYEVAVRATGYYDSLSHIVSLRESGDSISATRLDSLVESRKKQSGADTLGTAWHDAKIRCDLATREYNRFMR